MSFANLGFAYANLATQEQEEVHQLQISMKNTVKDVMGLVKSSSLLGLKQDVKDHDMQPYQVNLLSYKNIVTGE